METTQRLTEDALREMREVDIRSVDKSTLVDVRSVHINPDLPQQERIQDYIRQIKNPYCYRAGNMIVKIGFSGKQSLETCLKNAMFTES